MQDLNHHEAALLARVLRAAGAELVRDDQGVMACRPVRRLIVRAGPAVSFPVPLRRAAAQQMEFPTWQTRPVGQGGQHPKAQSQQPQRDSRRDGSVQTCAREAFL